jgi:methionyl-tRNA formyltransferase
VKIVLLGHSDIASLCALDRLLQSLPDCAFAVYLSQDPPVRDVAPSSLSPLQAFDAELSARFREGAFHSTHQRPLLGLELHTLQSPNSGAGLERLAAEEPDLIVSIRYRRILRDEAIAIPAHGVINLHSGVLPAYRGVMATFWAMLNEDPEAGCTLHRIVDAGIDTGPVIRIHRQALVAGHSYLANVLALYEPGVGMLTSAIRRLVSGSPVDTFKQSSGGRYYSAPDAADVDAFLAKGLVLFDGNEADIVQSMTRQIQLTGLNSE